MSNQTSGQGPQQPPRRVQPREQEALIAPLETMRLSTRTRVALAGLGVAAIVAGSLVGLSRNPMSSDSKTGQTKAQVEAENQEQNDTTTTTNPPVEGDSDYNPGNYPTSGAEDVDGF